MIPSRDKTSNGSDVQLHQTCPCRTREGQPDNRLILLSRQTCNDTKDIVSKTPLHLIFGNVECLTDFEASLFDPLKQNVSHFSLRTTFHCTPWPSKKCNGTTAIIAKSRKHHEGRAINRMKGQAQIWYRHALNRAQYVAKKFAGRLDRVTYRTYPHMKALRDDCLIWEIGPTISITIEKQLLYAKQKLLYLTEKEKRELDSSPKSKRNEMAQAVVDPTDNTETDSMDNTNINVEDLAVSEIYRTFDARMQKAWLLNKTLSEEEKKELREAQGKNHFDVDNWEINVAPEQAEDIVARRMEMVAGRGVSG